MYHKSDSVTFKNTQVYQIQNTYTTNIMDQASDARIKSDEAAARRVANSGGVGAFAVAQAAPGGRRQGPRVRRSASARRRARQRAGLEADDGGGGDDGGGADPNAASGTSGGGQQSEMEMVNPDSLIAADVEMDTYGMDVEDDYETLGFWALDRVDKFICGGICILVVALIVILGVGMSR